MKKLGVFSILLFLLLLLLCTSCISTNNTTPLVIDSIEEQFDNSQTFVDTINVDTIMSESVAPIEANEEAYYMIGLIPKEQIYLYHKEGHEGLILKYKDFKQSFNWTFSTPRLAPAQMQLIDIDSDLVKELVIALPTGSGTGISITEMYVLEIETDEFSNISNIYPVKFDEMAIKSQITSQVDYTIEQKDDILLGQIDIGEDNYSFNLGVLFETDQFNQLQPAYRAGSHISFDLRDERIMIYVGLAQEIDNFPAPVYFGSVLGDVKYKDSVFTLQDLTFVVAAEAEL